MAIDYKDPKLVAQMALTHMVQSSRAGLVTAKSGLTIPCKDSAAEVVRILNVALGSVSQNSFFSLDSEGSVIYKGDMSLHIPQLLMTVKSHEEGIYERATGRPVSISDVIKKIKLADLSSGSNDDNKPDKAAI
jgi:hypothetical protein